MINEAYPKLKSKFPYASQAILEQVIKKLEAKV
jgi:hypothetical protein